MKLFKITKDDTNVVFMTHISFEQAIQDFNSREQETQTKNPPYYPRKIVAIEEIPNYVSYPGFWKLKTALDGLKTGIKNHTAYPILEPVFSETIYNIERLINSCLSSK